MGFLKKITRPISRVLDKIVPNEIKPALPFLSAALPFFGPAQGLMGTGVRRLLMGGGANLLAQLSQEGNEGEVNPLSLGLATLTAGMTDPGAASYLQGLKSPTGDFAPARTGLQKFKDQALDLGITGVEKLQNLQEAVGAKGILSKEGAQLASIPLTQGTMDLATAETRRLEKQQAIDDALAQAELLADSGARAAAIRQFMEGAGYFSDEEIEETIAAAGYASGGRVGLSMGGDPDFAGIKGAMIAVDENMRADRAGDFFRLREEAIQKGDDDKIKEIESDFFKEFGMVMPKMAKDGGLMDLGGKEMDLRKGGFVPIGKKERADDVPARLSKNEFVMTADAVRGAGGGDINKGAKRMYETMNRLEARA